MKILYNFIILLLILGCSKEKDPTPSPPTSAQETPEPSVIKYTLTVSAGEGGSVSSGGGDYDEGSSVSITATPADGYEFTGWEGTTETSSNITITLNSDISITANFQEIIIPINYYSSGELVTNNNISAWFDRSLDVYGVRLLVAGEVGGHLAVTDEWAKKVAKVIK